MFKRNVSPSLLVSFIIFTLSFLSLPLQVGAQSDLQNLVFTSMCSFEPSVERRWRVRNPNDFDVPFTWQVYGTSQTGSGTAIANSDVFFFTSTIGGANTTKIFFGSGRERTKASSGANCSLTLTSMCSDSPSLTRRWRVRNSQYGSIDYSWQVFGTQQNGVGVVDFGTDSFFYTDTVGGSNTTKVFYPENKDTVKASGGAQCAQFSVAPACSSEGSAAFSFSVSLGSLSEEHAYTVTDDSQNELASGVIPAGYSDSDSPLVIEVSPTLGSTLSVNLSIPTLNLTSTQMFDPCGQCSGDGSSCGFCGVDQQTQEELFLDQCGVCGGDNSLCSDCAGVPNGSAEIDACGVCGGNNELCADCAGTPNGSAGIDGEGGCCLESEQDQCGVCFGDGTSCLGCESIDVTESLFSLDGAALELRNLVQRVARKAQRRGVARSFIRSARQEAFQLYEAAWGATWSVPTIVTQCSNTELCVTISNEAELVEFSSASTSLRDLTKELVRRGRRASRRQQRRFGRKALRRADSLLEDALSEVSDVPTEVSSCS